MSNSKKNRSKNSRIEFISKRDHPTSSTLNIETRRMISGTIAASIVGVFLFLGGLGVGTSSKYICTI